MGRGQLGDKMRSAPLYKTLAVLLVLIAMALSLSHFGHLGALQAVPLTRATAAMIAGFGIGVVAALIGVAGGELLIPTIVMLYAVDIKIAGSVALAVSLPTMLVAFARYSRDKSFSVLRANGYFVVAMAAGSVVGTVVGGLVLDVTPTA
ncbi:MAG: putative rane protein, partial [Mycobacterium sp.]|nr:putative rane protein [Mycobacterium sp.]